MMKKFLIFSLLTGFLCLSIQPLHSQEKKQEKPKKEDLITILDETIGKKAGIIYSSKGRKDPFKDQFGKVTTSKSTPTAKSGSPGMSISTVKLIGIVKSNGLFTAIISGPGNFPMFIKA